VYVVTLIHILRTMYVPKCVC